MQSAKILISMSKVVAGVIAVVGIIQFVMAIGQFLNNLNVPGWFFVQAIIQLMVYITIAWLANHIMNAIGYAAIKTDAIAHYFETIIVKEQRAEQIAVNDSEEYEQGGVSR